MCKCYDMNYMMIYIKEYWESEDSSGLRCVVVIPVIDVI